MTAILTTVLSGFGRRITLAAAIAAALGIAAWTLIRHGRLAAEADLAVRRADARVRALQSSKEIRHEVQNTDRAHLERRADRWMRD